ncbi:Rne/Rng family ribonuclease [Stakelama pacifica]|uniref:Ribonuclease E n=1 Tax=Stakelama pacifica TaxID=517720 RepID=A0A4R6FHH9_9SPHN|nr:Rne/Rng family ribonuclease [Stakelama pacifica]TDN80773.1 RNAse E [Stakelama pacifica]GGO97192.1 hypothetical protein GCM10011329_25420 [Stakelama pacifica]
MTMRMLIDARHREETRVAVVKGNRIEEFDFESAERKQLKGNIYLAKVTRVEPSLQAAFVDYGGNRHGFLAFSEIHPDYYQIPKEDRDALLAEEAEHAAEEAALRAEAEAEEEDGGDVEVLERSSDDEESDDESSGNGRKGNKTEKAVEALRQRRMSLRKRYKIQDVIRRRQVLLVQVVKEERGNKGAALTTYLSLAGRYCVLMPNTAHGGGISRKISSAADRKRLKTIMADMDLPPSMGCIVRTAGLQRTKTEIKRDFDYLARLWDGIREDTLKSSAPALVYGDSDLIKRAIRDIYNRDITEVVVEGEEGYRAAKDFMKLLMPSHARRVKQYADAVPLFQRNHVEDQLAAMYNPVVQLKSGGYLVINPTEALVSIDINSGRSTKEHNIEQTATATNLEAAQEIARQLRLRDMAGLVVIDFIDMDHNSNVRKVEKAMKEALKSDRARIQVGRISAFGLMEMSRQRLRTGVLEASTVTCPHCEGTGLVRTPSSSGLSALRLIEDEAARGNGSLLTLRCSQEAAFYVLNKKRADIAEIEERYGVSVEVESDGEMEGARMSVEVSGPPPAHAPRIDPIIEDQDEDYPEEIEDDFEDEAEADAEQENEREAGSDSDDEARRSKRRRRRRGRRGRGRDEQGEDNGRDTAQDDSDEREEAEDTDEPHNARDDDAEEGENGEKRRRRRRGKRGGRRKSGEGRSEEQDRDHGADEAAIASDDAPAAEEAPAPEPAPQAEPVEAAEAAPEAKPRRARRRPKARDEQEGDAAATAATATEAEAEPTPPATEEAAEAPKPKRTRRKKADAEGEAPAKPARTRRTAKAAADPGEAEEKPKPKRTRRKKADAPVTEPVAEEAAAPVSVEKSAPVEPSAAPASAGAAPADTAAADTEAAETAEGDSQTPRRGWWQRTFGA